MTPREVRGFLARYGPGVALLVITYVFATALRDFRDNFAAELWTALGYANPASVFTATELPVAAIALTRIGDHRQSQRQCARPQGNSRHDPARPAAAWRSHPGVRRWLAGPAPWMIASGAGLYVVYTPFNAMLFDRLVAAGGEVANAGFLIYVADSAGYAGSCALLLWRNFGLTQRRVADRVPIRGVRHFGGGHRAHCGVLALFQRAHPRYQSVKLHCGSSRGMNAIASARVRRHS